MKPEAPVTATRSPGSILTRRGSRPGTGQLSAGAGGRASPPLPRPLARRADRRGPRGGAADRRGERGTEGAHRRVAVGAGAHAGGELAVRAAGQGADAGRGRRHGGQQQAGDHRGGVPGLGQVNLEQQVGSRVADVGLEAGRAAGVTRPLPGRGARRVEDPGDAGEVGQVHGPGAGTTTNSSSRASSRVRAPGTGGQAKPGYSSPSTTSKSCASSPANAGAASWWVISTRSPGWCSASPVSTSGTRASSTDWKEATRSVPRTSVSEARS